MPRISVIVPTYRPGGLDVLFAGLQHQIFKDFELILVDMIAKYRRHLIQDMLSCVDWNFNIKYVEPFDNTFPFASYAHMFNTGLSYAEGELVFITGDYIWLPPDCLQKHSDFHIQNSNCACMAPHTYFELPELKNLPKWQSPEFQDAKTPTRGSIKFTYYDDLERGAYDHVMWSLFKEPLLSDPRGKYEFSKEYEHVDLKYSMPSQWLGFEHVHFKNESFPLEAALDINGCDEDFNGSHSFQDTEFAERLSRHGLKWYHDATNPVYGFSPKDSELPRLRRLRPHSSNRLLIQLKKQVGYRVDFSIDGLMVAEFPGRSCNDWSIREYRSKTLKIPAVKVMNFKGMNYKIRCFDHTDWHASWFSFTDEEEWRNKYWTIQPGDIVLDVGSAYGSYTFPALVCGAEHVYAWSPPQAPPGDEQEYITFKKSLELNEWSDRCTIYDYGVYYRDGWINTGTQHLFNTPPSTWIYSVPDGSLDYDREIIKVTTLDSWMKTVDLKRVDWMKIDVELAECEVLMGAKNLISQFHPKILIENHTYRDQEIEQKVRSILTNGKLGIRYKEIETVVHHSVSLSYYIPE